MRVAPDATEVREMVRHAFLDLGIGESTLAELAESIMIDEGRARARSYRIADLMAMWMIDIGIVQFYDSEGNMLRRLNLLMEVEPQPRRMAA